MEGMMRAARAGCALAFGALALLAGCGGNDGGGASGTTDIRTLAYVVTTCHVDPGGRGHATQALRIQVGDGEPVTVGGVNARVEGIQPVLCRFLGASRFGLLLQSILPFKRLAVTADGTRVVFEVGEMLAAHLALIPEATTAIDEGIYVVGSDGTGLRRLRDASREPAFRLTGPFLATYLSFPGFAVSPDGRQVVYTDLGEGPAGEAIQIFSLDLDSGRRLPLTALPPGGGDPCPVIAAATCFPGTVGPFFLDERQVVFFSTANPVVVGHPDGLNPAGDLTAFIPGSVVDPSFVISGAQPSVVVLPLDVPPEGPPDPFGTFPFSLEVFLLDGEDLLQLTSLNRSDVIDATLTADGRRVLFNASANPPAAGAAGDDEIRPRNPTLNCQVFSVDRTGADLRQLTAFRATDHPSTLGCYSDATADGCAAALFTIDPATGTLVFYSNCDPFGLNPNGGQLFALRSDGTGLRQITTARGLEVGADGTEDLELVGPHAYAAPVRSTRPR
jgi:hypothetical protein